MKDYVISRNRFAQIIDDNTAPGTMGSRGIVCKLEDSRATLPSRAHPDDAGADMFAWFSDKDIGNERFYLMNTDDGSFKESKYIIPPGGQIMVNTGVSMRIPSGYAGFLEARSSQRSKGITCLGTGIIDASYRGNIKVVLHNTSYVNYEVFHGDKIAQLIIQQVELVEFINCWDEDTNRGVGGFGSTGK